MDIGCGKGGAIYTLTRFPFKKVDGIEISKDLADIAKRNIDRLRIKNTEIFNCNALDFNKYDEYSFFYLYNPFDYKTLITVLDKILSARSEFYIIYYNPKYHHAFTSRKIELVDEFLGYYDNKINIYKKTRSE